jgi:tetratricopeptide (TPR) repeat protein
MKFHDIIDRLDAARNDPEALTLATLELVLEPASPKMRAAFEVAAIPHWFNADILAHMMQVGREEVNSVLEELCRLPMVESFSARNGWNVHEATRLAFRARLARQEPDSFRELSIRAANFFQGEKLELVVERLFHKLVAEPNLAGEELYAVWICWTRTRKDQSLQALGIMLRELLKLPELGLLPRAYATVCLGWIMQDRLRNQEIDALAREALTLFRQAPDIVGEGEAHCLLGQVLQRCGCSGEALREYEAFRQIMLQLTQRDPEHAGWRRDLAVAHNGVGSVLDAQGRLGEALHEFKASKQIMLQLTQRDSENAGWQGDLSIAHGWIGSMLRKQDRLDAARREYELSKQIMLQLTQRDPENARWQRELAVTHNCLGGMLQGQGQPSEALREFEASKQIMLQLTQRDPEHAGWQGDLAIVHNRVGSVLEVQGRLGEALREFEASKQITLQLTQRDSENAGWQWDLSIAHNWIGSMLRKQDRLDAARREYELSKQIMLQLTERDPENADWQRALAFTHSRIGCILEVQGKSSQAAKEYERSVTIANKLVTLDPTNLAWQKYAGDFQYQVERVSGFLESLKTES